MSYQSSHSTVYQPSEVPPEWRRAVQTHTVYRPTPVPQSLENELALLHRAENGFASLECTLTGVLRTSREHLQKCRDALLTEKQNLERQNSMHHQLVMENYNIKLQHMQLHQDFQQLGNVYANCKCHMQENQETAGEEWADEALTVDPNEVSIAQPEIETSDFQWQRILNSDDKISTPLKNVHGTQLSSEPPIKKEETDLMDMDAIEQAPQPPIKKMGTEFMVMQPPVKKEDTGFTAMEAIEESPQPPSKAKKVGAQDTRGRKGRKTSQSRTGSK
ncbi:MAG: hypothetical protein M1816_005067 [Peltula sp. TS41687]|nr:MAG: hypothetical protein M1816_005067 [Peltula sp. TS41687]